MTRPFVLVDRDGTLNEERDHLRDPDQVRLIPGSAAALRRLREAGMGLVVVTNQADVGRGLLPPTRLELIHERLNALLAEEGAEVDAILHCPHTPDEACPCRKPRPGMALEAARRFGFEPRDSFVVGDHASDVGMGRSIGATTFLVLTGHGAEEADKPEAADHVVPDLSAAADIISDLASSRR